MLTKIDDLIRPDHHHLDPQDECYFIGEYTAGRGFKHSTTNQLIYNLKKSVEKRGLAEYWYKGDAVQRAAFALTQYLNPAFIQRGTFVPIPPSKVRTDPLYDDRMTQVLRLVGANADVREIVVQSEGMHEAHTALFRPGPTDYYRNYEIDGNLVEPTPAQIAVVDDVLTTGAHFKAMKMILEDAFPGVPVIGLFLARRVPDTE